MHVNDQAGIAVDVRHPIETPLIRSELGCAQRELQKLIRFTSLRIDQRTGFVSKPPIVVKRRRAHHRIVRLWSRKRVITPMCRQLADESGMFRLSDYDEFTIGLLTNDHDASV